MGGARIGDSGLSERVDNRRWSPKPRGLGLSPDADSLLRNCDDPEVVALVAGELDSPRPVLGDPSSEEPVAEVADSLRGTGMGRVSAFSRLMISLLALSRTGRFLNEKLPKSSEVSTDDETFVLEHEEGCGEALSGWNWMLS